MVRTSIVSKTSVHLKAARIPGALLRHQDVPGFSQEALSRSRILLIGAGGLIGHIAPALVRKGVGGVIVLDDDIVEPSNLNRQFFYAKDLGKNKAIALSNNLLKECTYATHIMGQSLRFEEAIAADVDLDCDVAVCGVDNNPTRVAASVFFGQLGVPVIFTAVSADADHGYVFIQEKSGPCFGCVFPDAIDSRTYPCPGTPAILDILQIVGALAIYALDSCLMSRPRSWNYRESFLSNGAWDGSKQLQKRADCTLCSAAGVAPSCG